MEARDLRPNNIVLDNLGNYVVIEEIKRDDENIIHEKGEYRLLTRIDKNTTYEDLIQSFQPIPLTEEILLKCGFDVSKYSDTLFILELTEWSSIQVHLYKNKCATELSISKHSQEVEVYFLHQLQNLYFALTNEELNINL